MKQFLPKRLVQYREIIWMLAKTDLKMRYEGSFLGIIWVFLKPFSIFLVINYVFSTIFHNSTPNYSIKLLIGLILYNFFQDSTTNGMLSFVSKTAILKKVNLPKWIIIISSTIHSGIAFLFNISILFIFLFGYYHIFPGPLYVLLFFYYAILLYGVTVIFSFIMAPLYTKFRDLNQIWEVLLQVLFFGSPIFYPITAIPYPVRSILYANPLTYILEHSRYALVDSRFTHLNHHIIFLCIFIPAFVISLFLLKKFSRNLVEQL
jgi:ABC-2 type transport system permease protein